MKEKHKEKSLHKSFSFLQSPFCKFIVFLLFANAVRFCHSITSPESTCITSTTIGKGMAGLPCQFPFIVRNKTYYSCTFDYSHITDYNPWCSTKVDDVGNHISAGNNWGICDDEVNCPIPPRYCGEPFKAHPDIKSDDFNVDIQQQPWMVSLGQFLDPNKWEHQCGGSLITSTHVLTAAHCFGNLRSKSLSRYTMRLGVVDLSTPSTNGIVRRVREILTHPKYLEGKAYFDVGVAIADRSIEFTDFVRPICLPMRPVDDVNYLEGDLVTLAGWGSFYNKENQLIDKNPTLKLINLRVLPRDECDRLFSAEEISKSGLPEFKLRRELPLGFKRDLSCVGNQFKPQDNACEGDSGSPVVRVFEGTARGSDYYEQHFIVSTGIDCRLPATIYVRVTDRQILTWIQKVTDTTPLLMVVGGFSKVSPVPTAQGLLKDVELISTTPNNLCSKHVRPIFGKAFQLPDGQIEDEAETLGLTGQFTKNAAIVCGGKNFVNNLDTCYEFNPAVNKWFPIPSMIHRRYEGSSVVDEDDNLWVLGGTHDSKGSDSTEVYQYRPNGQGRWRKGRPLPPELRDTGISSHCTVRLNSTHVFLGGGFAQAYTVTNPLTSKKKNKDEPSVDIVGEGAAVPRRNQNKAQENDSDVPESTDETLNTRKLSKREMPNHSIKRTRRQEEKLGGGIQFARAWIYDGSQWNEIEDMSEPRDRPACSLVQLDDGAIRVLVAGGCNGWCKENPAIRSAEMYNPETNQWTRVADLPVPLNSAKMELLDGIPTIVGGFDTDSLTQNGILYQYFADVDQWVPHSSVTMRIPRTSAAVFQVPKTLFKYC